MMGTLLERPIIREKFEHKYLILLQMVNQEMDAVKKLFDNQLSLAQTTGPVINKNMPRVAGVLKWCQEIRERVHLSIDKLRAVNHG